MVQLLAATTFLLGLAIPLQAAVKPFKIAILYSDLNASDIRCTLEGASKRLYPKQNDIITTYFSYGLDPIELQRIAEKIVQENYDVVIGPILSHEAQVTIEIFKKSSTIQILPIATDPSLATLNPKLIRILPNAKRYAMLAAKYALSEPNIKSILVVANESRPYSVAYKTEFLKQARSQGFTGEVQDYTYVGGNADLTKIENLIREKTAQFIYAPIYASDLLALYRRLTKSKVKLKIFTHAGLYDAKGQLQQEYDRNVEIHFNGIWDQTTPNRRSRDYLQAIATSCDTKTIKPWSFAAWEAYDLTVATHIMSPALTGESLSTAITSKHYTGILGPWNLDKNRNPVRSLPVYRLSHSGIKLERVVGWNDTPSTEED